MDLYVVNCLNILFEIIVGNEFLLEYMFNLEPMTYEYSRFSDWIRPYLKKELDKAYRTMSMYNKANKKEESIRKCFGFLDDYEHKLRNYERKLQGLPEEEETPQTEDTKEETKEAKASSNEEDKKEEDVKESFKVIDSHPQKYIINCVTNMEEISKEEKEEGGISVILSKVFCQIAESQPTTIGNNTLPGYAFYNAKIEAEEFDNKYISSQFDEAKEEGEGEGDKEKETVPKESVSDLDGNIQIGVNKVSVTNKNEGEDDEEEKNSDWNLPKIENDFVVAITVDNQLSKTQVVKVRVVCEDDLAKRNIKAPANSIEAEISPMSKNLWMCIHKVDPSQGWGKFRVEWTTEEKSLDTYNRSNLNFGGGMDDDSYDGNITFVNLI